ncbi:MAG: hypothetical protein VX642_15050 [Bdellovibrionota bacterium]|nr:hypothetical protein [Bdellovibrionota bacterium]
MRNTPWLFLLFPLFLSSCLFSDEGTEEVIEYTKADLRASVTNPEVPSRLWEMVEEQYSVGLKVDEYSEKLDREKTKLEAPKKVFETMVYLKEKTPGSLAGYNYAINLGSSGNLLDLKDYLNETKFGSFYLDIQLSPLNIGDGGTSKAFRVFHLSNVKKLKIGNEILGGGCNEFRDITKFFIESQKKGGILVSARGGRHMSLLAGTFIFVAVDSETLYFSNLVVTDSRFEKFLCRK